MTTKRFAVGSKVKLTVKFLRSTGQISGHEPHGRWTVVACECGLCSRGGHVATDEVSIYGGQRHLAVGNVESAGAKFRE